MRDSERGDGAVDSDGAHVAATVAGRHLPRRSAVGLVAASGVVALAGGGARIAAAADDPAKQPPQPGDGLVFADGERKGQAIAAADLTAESPFAAAWAKDAAGGTVRSGNRLHRVLLVKLDPAALDESTKGRAAEGGVVAYSGFCTHAGCPIQHWKAAENVIYCHCHSSSFDPRANGKVVGGPARRSLAGLPLKVGGDNKLVVAGEFTGKLGPPKA